MGGNIKEWLIALLVVAAVIFGIYWFAVREAPAPEVSAPVTEPAPETQPNVDLEEPAEPVIPPVPEPVEPEDPPRQLPALNDSDREAHTDIISLSSDGALAKWIVPDEVVRKWVAAVNTATKGDLMHKNRPFNNVDGKLAVKELETRDDGQKVYVLSQENYQRYDQPVRLFAMVDTDTAVNLYQFWYPRLKQAYGELGLKNKNFHAAVMAAIDQALAAPEVEGPIKLVRPTVYYKFEDEKLEKMPGLHKLMIRIGPDNAARVKEKLRELKAALQNMPSEQ
ncbi:DUF3014 domain-containing protein [Microbulbifer salipaludis]|uniref:DUF3014 domain-containing protein n=1 Tax=Microbulbifer salipaludis TaxID=187980 RepID=A0ABS3E536_9GAMM|nr:DUF3014 domain-containing protein [Microbulbifer salipaludis]MBN8430405.1 DUF3014 domain-containing protein [Microbulbifer salipaludis]